MVDKALGKAAVLFYYDHLTRYSINALIASIDPLKDVNTYLVENREAFIPAIDIISRKYSGRCITAYSVLTTSLVDENYLSFIRSTVEYAKRRGCITIVGGPHASGDPIGSIESLGFNYAFIGEGEQVLRDFVENLLSGGDLLNTKSVFTKIGGEYVFTGRAEPVDLDKYHPFPYWRYIFNPIEITRGCIYGCKYCQVSYTHGFTYRHRSVEKIVRYAEIMVLNGVRDLRFISPNSLAYGSRYAEINLSAVEELLSKLHILSREKDARIFFGTFPSEVRPEYVSEDVARILKQYVYNKTIILGAQTGSNRLLREIGRNHSIEDVYNAVEILNKYGFEASVDYIVGLPGETEDDLRETLASMKKLVEMGARIHLHTFMPLPGSPYAYTKPSKIPDWFRKEVSRIIGSGRAYGEWLNQERIAWRIVELRNRGVILPKPKHRVVVGR